MSPNNCDVIYKLSQLKTVFLDVKLFVSLVTPVENQFSQSCIWHKPKQKATSIDQLFSCCVKIKKDLRQRYHGHLSP